MKKVAVIVLFALLAGSCSLFEKPSMTQEEIDVMVAENLKLQEELVNAQHEASMMEMRANECAKVLEEMQKEEVATTGMYYVISGSFKSAEFAKDYAAKMKQMGGEGAIVNGPSDFKLVSFSSHDNLREAITAMEKARMNIASEAWVYMNK